MNCRLHFFTHHAFPICAFLIASSRGNSSHKCLSFEALTAFAITPAPRAFASPSPSRKPWKGFAAELREPVILPKLNDSQSYNPYFYQETKELVRQAPEPAILVFDQPPFSFTNGHHISTSICLPCYLLSFRDHRPILNAVIA